MEKTVPSIWCGQQFHFASLVFLILIVALAWNFLGKPIPVLFWTAVITPITHQIYVWLAWRLEIRSKVISKTIGFQTFFVFFVLFFLGRFITLVNLAWHDRGSLALPIITAFIVVTVLAILGVYAMYSVVRYFGMTRASGADHFDPKYRDMPFVKKGIFRFTNNGMYVFAFLNFWAIAFAFNSSAALVVAAFSHIYIWVHHIATELPDMDYLYTR